MLQLPPPPVISEVDSYIWLDWFRQLHRYVVDIGEVPEDGNTYGRKDGVWVIIP